MRELWTPTFGWLPLGGIGIACEGIRGVAPSDAEPLAGFIGGGAGGTRGGGGGELGGRCVSVILQLRLGNEQQYYEIFFV